MLISKDDKIFVTGHKGMVGSAVCRKLKKNNVLSRDVLVILENNLPILLLYSELILIGSFNI